MGTIPLRLCALACSLLFVAPFSSFAQTSPEGTQPRASGNAAEASLQRALARALTEPPSPEDVTFPDPDQLISQNQGNGNTQNQPKPAADKPAAPSLGDLGFPTSETQGNSQEQARLDKRSRMLRMHQKLGLITTAPMLATVITGGFAGGKSTSSSERDLHAALGSLTTGLYFTTAYYSIFAPKVPGTQARGPIRLHKALAWIHGPGMVLTPILGVMAFEQKSHGEKVHGVASAHGAVAVVTAAAYGLAILSVSVKF